MRHLADLLGNDHPLFVRNIAEMEKASGNAGIDTAIVGEVMEKAHTALRLLGIDSSDVTAEEAYHALNSSVLSGRADELLKDTEYVLFRIGSDVVSFNIQDVIESAHHELSFAERKLDHAQRHLRMEVVKRYAEHERTHVPQIRKLAREIEVEQDMDSEYTPINVQAPHAGHGPSMLMIGDIITDAFIKLSEEHAEVHTDDKGYKRLTFELGAKLPYDEVDIVEAVECSPNAAVSMSRLGLSTSLMSWLGDDEPGKGMVQYLKQQNVGTDDLVVEKNMKSNYHYVLRYGADRTKLQKFEDYSYEWHEPKQKPDWIYLGVLGEKTWPLHEALLKYLNDNPEVKLAFQPGMYHLTWGTEKMRPFYERAEVVIMNREEAAQVTGKDRGDVAVLLKALHEFGVEVSVVTDGADGAYATDGNKNFFMPNYPDPAPPYDRTGAGDAFASTIVAALALEKTIDEALTWAPINSMSVVQKLGAQAGLLRKDELLELLGKAPEDYKISEL